MKAPPHYRFRLYVAGDSANAAESLANLEAFCAARLESDYAIEVIDVFQHPERALAEGVFMTPMLVKVAPLPIARIVGTLSKPEPLVVILGLDRRHPRDGRPAGVGRGKVLRHRRTAAAEGSR